VRCVLAIIVTLASPLCAANFFNILFIIIWF